MELALRRVPSRLYHTNPHATRLPSWLGVGTDTWALLPLVECVVRHHSGRLLARQRAVEVEVDLLRGTRVVHATLRVHKAEPVEAGGVGL